MLEPVKKTHFREISSGRMVEVNPALVRMLRIVDGATEIVFSETHSVVVKASRAAVSSALWSKEPGPLPRAVSNHTASAAAN